MHYRFVSLFVVAAFVFGATALHAAASIENTAEVASPDVAGVEGDSFTTPSDPLSDDLAFSLNLDANPAAAGAAFSLTRPDVAAPGALSTTLASSSPNGVRVSVPLPEPSSQAAIYVLGGVVGLGFVVMRRRTA